MKKILLVIIAAILAMPICAEENVNENVNDTAKDTAKEKAKDNVLFTFNSGNIGIGANIPKSDDYYSEAMCTFANLGVEFKKSNIGLEFYPFKSIFWDGAGPHSFGDSGISLLNMDVFWHPVNDEFLFGNVFCGPFASINYFFLNEEIDWNRYVFTAGVHFGIRANLEKYRYNIFTTEVGYRRIDGKNKYFIGAKIDLISIFLVWLYMFAI